MWRGFLRVSYLIRQRISAPAVRLNQPQSARSAGLHICLGRRGNPPRRPTSSRGPQPAAAANRGRRRGKPRLRRRVGGRPQVRDLRRISAPSPRFPVGRLRRAAPTLRVRSRGRPVASAPVRAAGLAVDQEHWTKHGQRTKHAGSKDGVLQGSEKRCRERSQRCPRGRPALAARWLSSDSRKRIFARVTRCRTCLGFRQRKRRSRSQPRLPSCIVRSSIDSYACAAGLERLSGDFSAAATSPMKRVPRLCQTSQSHRSL